MRNGASALNIKPLQRIKHSDCFINLQAQFFVESQNNSAVLHLSAFLSVFLPNF